MGLNRTGDCGWPVGDRIRIASDKAIKAYRVGIRCGQASAARFREPLLESRHHPREDCPRFRAPIPKHLPLSPSDRVPCLVSIAHIGIGLDGERQMREGQPRTRAVKMRLECMPRGRLALRANMTILRGYYSDIIIMDLVKRQRVTFELTRMFGRAMAV